MESDSIDLVFADPPFNLDKLYPSGMDDDLKTHEYLHWCEQWLSECARVLKPGGWAIMLSPIDLSRDKTFEDLTIVLPEEQERVFGHKDHRRIYGRDYKDRLEKAGFTVKVENYLGELGTNMIKKHALKAQVAASVDQNIYLCTKP